ncbi:MAG: hypothetical protein KKB50_03690 [Planctomycetes bacterium]|nr:hypothetical protein [Planctomycetota bacterium]
MRRFEAANRRATILLMVVGLLAMLFIIVSAYITLARFERQILGQVQHQQKVEQIVDSVNDLVRSQIRQQWADNNGDLLTGTNLPDSDTFSYEDIPGYGGSTYLASNEPVRDLSFGNHYVNPGAFFYPAMTALDGSQTAARRDGVSGYYTASLDTLMGVELLDRLGPSSTNNPNYTYELIKRSRAPFMDADGDGIADAAFIQTGVATELANAVAGVPVRLPNVWPPNSSIPNDPNTQVWRRFDEQARYEVAVKVISHGGMVSLGSRGEWDAGRSYPPNRRFVANLFNRIRHPNDQQLEVNDDALFNELAAGSAAVEPLLRRRGGVLPSSFVDQDGDGVRDYREYGRVPGAVRDLEALFPRSTVSTFEYPGNTFLKDQNWQRFNLATLVDNQNTNEWRAWWRTQTYDPSHYNMSLPGRGGLQNAELQLYDRRHLLTTVNNSDEISRRLTDDPQPNKPGLYNGQLKFFLGDVYKCFWDNGNFRGAQPHTHAVIERLAGAFYDMLSDHKGWSGETDATETVSRLEQAYMLAVNTVAFAAPRDQATGLIDVVTHTTLAGNTYVGYAPQPFITQAIMYDKEDDDTLPQDEQEKIAIAVELFNPNEPYGASTDAHALNLAQFALSLNDSILLALDPAVNPVVNPLDPGNPGRMPGRSYIAYSIREKGDGGGSSNRFFANRLNNVPAPGVPHADIVLPDLYKIGLIDVGGPKSINVKLWRSDTSGAAWYLVDQMEVRHAGPPDESTWFAQAYRDTRSEAYWGVNPAMLHLDGTARYATWRMAVAFEPGDKCYAKGSHNGAPEVAVTTLAKQGPDPDTGKAGPTVPLYCMNANKGATKMQGAYRPNAFPTVGFMYFVPRFSHVVRGGALNVPMGKTLRDQWDIGENDSRNYNADTKHYPADFGHMPVFDNKQEPKDAGYFTGDEGGRIPWGMLVFDYFTTVNPVSGDADLDGNIDGPGDFDPLRVPGRININVAPWTVLAALPLLNPQNQLSAVGASPAFWKYDSGILFGAPVWDLTKPRFDESLIESDAQGTYTLGTDLAQAIVSYRDRVRYVVNGNGSQDGLTPYVEAEERNVGAGTFPPYRNTDVYDLVRRGSTDAKKKYGFLTLGELANVKGFDSTRYLLNGQRDFVEQPAAPLEVVNNGGDYIKAISLLALLDSHYITTRSNTFTVYVAVNDRDDPQASVRSQMTVDRSNLLPRVALVPVDAGIEPKYWGEMRAQDEHQGNGNGILDQPVEKPVLIKNHSGLPEIVAQRQVGYYNARFDE